jgi:hypothetical protein
MPLPPPRHLLAALRGETEPAAATFEQEWDTFMWIVRALWRENPDSGTK